MKAILAATDLSARSDRAIERALMIAQLHQADLHVVHIVDEALPESIAGHQRQAAEENILNHIVSLRARGVPNINTEVLLGKSSRDIVLYARERDVGLIVLGARDIAFTGAYRGTTSEKIVRMGNLPVLVVKDRAQAPYQRIAIAMDFSVHSRRAVEFALTLAPDAEFHLIHAYQVPFAGFMYGSATEQQVREQEEQRMKQVVEQEMTVSLRAMGIDAELNQVSRLGDVRQVLDEEVKRLKPDLIAMGTHGRTGIALTFLGSVAEDVLGNPPCDTLAVKAW